MPRFRLGHSFSNRYDRHVNASPHTFRCIPQIRRTTNYIYDASFDLLAANSLQYSVIDQFDNHVMRVHFRDPIESLSFINAFSIHIPDEPSNMFDFIVDPPFANLPFHLTSEMTLHLGPYLALDEASNVLKSFCSDHYPNDKEVVRFIYEFNTYMFDTFVCDDNYKGHMRGIEHTLVTKDGSARELTWAFINIMRYNGIPARFVSGYLIQHTDVEEHVNYGCWADLFIPGAGWIGVCPTYGLFCSDDWAIPVAVGCRPEHCDIVHGNVDHAEVAFEYNVTLKRL